MKLGTRKAGTSTSFVDTDSDEILLQFSWDSSGITYFAYHIYDEAGNLVSDSGGVKPLHPVSIVGPANELLLEVPEDSEQHVNYRLYNKKGRLLTVSDGGRTHIFSFLRMEPRRTW